MGENIEIMEQNMTAKIKNASTMEQIESKRVIKLYTMGNKIIGTM
jgi:hypothetical protein